MIVVKLFVLFFLHFLVVSCEKRTEQYVVMYRVIEYKDGFKVSYKMNSDTLFQEQVKGVYTLSNYWYKKFVAKSGDIVYVSVLDTVINSFSRVQILLDGKIYKEKVRTQDRFKPVVVTGVLP